MITTKSKLDRARASLVIEQPFIAAILCSLPMEIDPTLNPPTLATDGRRIIIHPEWVDNHTTQQVMWALGHETMHCVFKHMLNRGSRNPVKWNIAGDYIINDLLEDNMRGARPPGVYFDPSIVVAGRGTTEGVYNILPDPPEGGGGWDMCRDMQGDAADIAEAEAVWSVKVAQAAAVAKAQGRLSKRMEQFVGELLNPKVPWQEVLRRFMMRSVRTDRSFSRPARRYLHQQMFLPGKSGVGMGDILIALDESGSVSPEEVRVFASEVNGIKEDASPSMIHVLHFAGQVDYHETFGPDDELDIRRRTNGGTAFSPIFRYAAEHGIDPDCCVVLTDLCCSDFGPHPDYPVLWVTTGAMSAPWGEIISIRD